MNRAKGIFGTGVLTKYLGNSAWLMSDSILTNLFSLVVFAIVARVLGPTEYGAYAYVFSLAQLFSVVGQLGLDGLLIRELVSKPEKEPETLGTTGVLRIIGYCIGAIGCLFYGVVIPAHSDTERTLFIFAFLFILFSPGPAILNSWFNSRVGARYSSKARMIGTFLGGGLKILVVILGFGIVYVGAVQVLTVVLIFGILFWFYTRRQGPSVVTWKFSGARAKSLLAESWMIFLGSMMAMIYLKIDLVMLRWWAGAEEVGIYSAAARLSEIFYFIPAALVITFFPLLIELHKKSVEDFYKRFSELLGVLVFLAYCVMLGIYIFGEWFINFTFGTNYLQAASVLQIHMLAMPFIFMRYAFSRWILIEKFPVFSLITQSAGALSNVALNVLLIPKYGMMGAAIATLISYALASYFTLLLSPKTRPVFILMSKSLLFPWRAISVLKKFRKKFI